MFEIIHFPCTGLHFHEALGLTIYCSLLVIVLEYHQNNSGNANITKFNTKWQNAKYDNFARHLDSVRQRGTRLQDKFSCAPSLHLMVSVIA